jgi:hypothetical protein
MTPDLLVSADLLVADAREAMEALVDRVGLPPARDSWVQDFPGSDNLVIWARTSRDLAFAPTRVEVIAPQGAPGGTTGGLRAYIPEIFAQQGERPLKTHSTVLAVQDVGVVGERLRSLGVRHRVDPPCDVLPFDRIWLGMSPEDPSHYLPATDAGLRLEIIPTDVLGLPAAMFDEAVAPPPAGSGADLLRVVARQHLVADLDAAVALVARILDWEPAEVSDHRASGVRRAVYRFRAPRSADLELLAPTSQDGDARRFAAAHGPGPYVTQVAVGDLAAKAHDLRARGTRFVELPADDLSPAPRLRVVDPAIGGILLELVELSGR